MGLLDKANSTTTNAPAPAATTAVPLAETAVPVAAAVPTAQTVAQPVAKPAKAAKAKKAKKPKARPKGLPSEFEIAPATARFIGSLSNFIINYGLLIGAAFVVVFVNSTVANSASILGAMALYVLNVFVIPVRFGRNVGQFVSRTKYINASGNPPTKIHAVLNSMVGFMFLVGGCLVMFNMSELGQGGETNGIIRFAVGVLLMSLLIIDRQFKRASDLNQGMFDRAFATYLVKHAPVASEGGVGWGARLDSMGDWGDRLAQRQLERQEKAAAKAATKAAEAAAKATEDADGGSDSEVAEDSDNDA
ncbi:MAG TPA: hypothetical protein D7I05_06410 [Candidatus Poseidoniales archaeon]|nr:MAG TPA: hypothetical protein D7I05_06410 [Candidatus Poseidoniales archaeon]